MKNLDTPEKRRIKFVLSGSGLLFPVHIGGLAACIEYGFQPSEYLGCSGGAVVAAAACMGMEPADMIKFCKQINPAGLLDSNLASPSVFKFAFNTDGIYAGNRILAAFREIMPARMSGMKLPFHAVTFNLSRGSHQVWSSKYTPDMEPALIVRASMSIPLLFNPVRLPSGTGPFTLVETTGRRARAEPEFDIHVDGGVGANFPLDFFGTGNNVIGLRFKPEVKARAINDKVDIIKACIDGFIESSTREHVEDAIHARQIYLETLGSGLDFDLTADKIDRLVDEGYESARKTLDCWRKTPNGGLNA